MLGMFWIALELSNPMAGLITRLSLLLKNLTAFKFGEVAKSGNADWQHSDAVTIRYVPCKPLRRRSARLATKGGTQGGKLQLVQCREGCI